MSPPSDSSTLGISVYKIDTRYLKTDFFIYSIKENKSIEFKLELLQLYLFYYLPVYVLYFRANVGGGIALSPSSRSANTQDSRPAAAPLAVEKPKAP